jgi:hypothetical protein
MANIIVAHASMYSIRIHHFYNILVTDRLIYAILLFTKPLETFTPTHLLAVVLF